MSEETMTRELVGKYNTTKAFFDKGYALPLYGVHTHMWVYADKTIVLPHGAVEMKYTEGIPCALWTDVLEAEKEKA